MMHAGEEEEPVPFVFWLFLKFLIDPESLAIGSQIQMGGLFPHGLLRCPPLAKPENGEPDWTAC